MASKRLTLAPGTVVWIPCELKSGIFPTEQGVKIEVSVGDNDDSIYGFIPKQDIRVDADRPDRGRVRAVVHHAVDGKVAILLRGEILSRSNPVIVPREWLESVATTGG